MSRRAGQPWQKRTINMGFCGVVMEVDSSHLPLKKTLDCWHPHETTLAFWLRPYSWVTSVAKHVLGRYRQVLPREDFSDGSCRLLCWIGQDLSDLHHRLKFPLSYLPSFQGLDQRLCMPILALHFCLSWSYSPNTHVAIWNSLPYWFLAFLSLKSN